MPGFPFGPMRSNTRAGLPLTERILVPAVRRSLAVGASGVAAARVMGSKAIVPAMATPDARICRRVTECGIFILSHCRLPISRRLATKIQFDAFLGLLRFAYCCRDIGLSPRALSLTTRRHP